MATTFYESRDEKLFIGEMTHYPFPPHVHEVAEVVCLLSGSAVMGIDGCRWELAPGDLAVIFPLTPHSYESLSEDVSGLAAIFPPDTIAEFSALFRTRVPRVPVLTGIRDNPDLWNGVTHLRALSDTPDSPLRLAWLHLLLAGAFAGMDFQDSRDFSSRDLGYRIIHYVSEHAFEPITIRSVAHEMGISYSHLSHFFSQKMRIHFRRFVNAIRIDQARMMMRNPDMTLTTLCDACGFSSIRTFRRAFQLETGQLPSRFREE